MRTWRMARYKAPKGITSHPGVASCEFGPAIGFDDYDERGFVDRHAVELKDGWRFGGKLLHDGVRQSARFRSVAEFRECRPVRIEEDGQAGG